MSAPAAWLADPNRRHQLRYWNGTAWTDHVSDNGVASMDPVSVPPAAGGWMDRVKTGAQQAADSASAAIDGASEAISRQTGPQPAATAGGDGPPLADAETGKRSVADELIKLAELRDRGVLTEEEFAAQKARILA